MARHARSAHTPHPHECPAACHRDDSMQVCVCVCVCVLLGSHVGPNCGDADREWRHTQSSCSSRYHKFLFRYGPCRSRRLAHWSVSAFITSMWLHARGTAGREQQSSRVLELDRDRVHRYLHGDRAVARHAVRAAHGTVRGATVVTAQRARGIVARARVHSSREADVAAARRCRPLAETPTGMNDSMFYDEARKRPPLTRHHRHAGCLSHECSAAAFGCVRQTLTSCCGFDSCTRKCMRLDLLRARVCAAAAAAAAAE